MATKVRIKRSTTVTAPTTLDAGELAYTSNGDILYIGSPDSNTVTAIAGKRNPGVLTANQALVVNTASGIDKIIVANLVPQTIYANNGFGTANYVLVTPGDGTNVYWESASAVGGVNASAQYTFSNTITFNGAVVANTVNASSFTTSGVTVNTTGVFTNGTVNASILSVDSNFVVNTSQVTIGSGVSLSANGSVGTANQVLRSNGSSIYWADDAGDISGVSAGNGLSGGGTSGDITVSVLANNGILANSSGIFAVAANGISVDSSGINVVGGEGLVSNASGVHVGAANGITVSSDAVAVTGGSTLTVNTSGVHVNTDLSITSITISANATFNGNTIIGSDSNDRLTVSALLTSNLMPSTNNTYHLGNSSVQWAQVHAANVHGVTGVFDGNVEIAGDLIVTGNVTATNVGSLIVGDAKILLAANNPGDVLDIGFSGMYTDGGSTVRHAGLFRDASDNGIFKFFSNTTQDLTGNNVVDVSATGYTLAILQTYLVSGGLTTNSTSANLTANSTYSVGIVANTLTLSTPLAGNSGGTGLNTYTIEDILVANSSNGFRKLALSATEGHVLQSNGTALIYDHIDAGVF